MQISDRTGIACDHCGTQYKNDFTYYSWDLRPVTVNNGMRPQLSHIFHTHVIFSLDICTACFDKFKDDVIKHYMSGMDQRKRHAFTICELTGEKLTGTYDYYHIEVIRVNVLMTGQPNICTKCQHKSFEENKVCSKCQNTEFVKPAALDMDKRFLELSVSEKAYQSIRMQAEKIRKVAGEWDTSS